MSQLHFHPLWQLVLCRIRVFYRQPEAVFWTYGFPLVMLTAMGLAFREESKETILVDVVGPQAEAFEARLAKDSRFKVKQPAANEWRNACRRARLIWSWKRESLHPNCHDSGSNHTGQKVCWLVNLSRMRSCGAIYRPRQPIFRSRIWKEVGSRYIDFLLPGMIGMNLMGGGMWGIGFVVVDMRVRKLLKRLQATPMRRSDFLLSLMLVRLIFAFFDMGFLTLFGHYAFGVQCRGSLIDLALVMLVGGAAFAGIGLLVACRAQTTETISGLMNLVMLPMWILSGVFFSSERFPEITQPIIQALPLTALINALRGVMLDGDGLFALWRPLLLLVVWGAVSFTIALRGFRWK